MDSTDNAVLEAAQRWSALGHRLALFTVARTWGSAPRPVGAWMALRDDGLVQGSVSGGCIEDDLIARMAAGEFTGDANFTLMYGVTREDAQRYGLPCGGTLELLVEPAPDVAALELLRQRIAAGQLVLRTVSVDRNSAGHAARLGNGGAGVRLQAGCRGDYVQWDGRQLVTVHGPAWRLLIIGAGQISRSLAVMAQALDYEVLVCDPRVEYSTEWQVPGARLVPGMPDDVVLQLALDPHSAVVALTHDPKLDDLALLEALKSPAFYVGALGSRANNDKRRLRLLEHFDLTQHEVARLHGPAGLHIGSRMPAEIAVSIAAEMTAVRHGVSAVRQVQQARTEALDDALPSGCRRS
jgi:xanthine dehydrogenase accessory factor